MATYCVSDLHGNYILFTKLKEMLQPNDICYVLGDCADRGPKGWQIIKEVYNNPQFIYLKGNHEEMLYDTIKAYSNYYKNESYELFSTSLEFSILRGNGGKGTFKDWLKDGADSSWIDKLRQLPEEKQYLSPSGNLFLLSHAGYTPGIQKTDVLWSRQHFFDVWPNNADNIIVVHGHTPTVTLTSDEIQGTLSHPIHTYANGHKINIDTGASFSGMLGVLNLDTLEKIILREN